jgi:hypothetical protein
LKPLQSIRDAELDAAEKSWSSWLAMEDWMIGPRAPQETGPDQSDQRSRPWDRAGGVAGYDDGLPDGI